MAAGRIANIAAGIAMVPLLIHYLGGRGFAVWAILLSCGAAFTALDLGLPTAIVKHLAVAFERRNGLDPGRLVSTAIALVVAVYSSAGLLVLWASMALASWLGVAARAGLQ
jgi:O-antigen/teichoic acid export membrane protein